jgi:hypothetical protein
LFCRREACPCIPARGRADFFQRRIENSVPIKKPAGMRRVFFQEN